MHYPVQLLNYESRCLVDVKQGFGNFLSTDCKKYQWFWKFNFHSKSQIGSKK